MGEERLLERPLSYDFLQATPAKLQQGFKTLDVQVTCFHCAQNYIVFGTDCGCAFLHNRNNGHMVKLLSQQKTDCIKAVRVLSGIECQVAMGTEDGKVIIIVISSNFNGPTKQVQKFFLGKIHTSAVSCLEWSSNGMKLFSADTSGSIYLTTLDLETNSCRASNVHSETSEVLQMEYRHKILLISTLEYAGLYFVDKTSTVIPIGSKPIRKGKYGACFNADTVVKEELRIFATRPNLRFWVAAVSGDVLSTVKMKENLQKTEMIIPLTDSLDVPHDSNIQFGKIKRIGSCNFVTFNDTSLCVVNHKTNSVVGLVRFMGNIIDVVTSDDEVLVLCSNRTLHRLAWKNDAPYLGLKTDSTESSVTDFFKKDVKESYLNFKNHLSPYMMSIQTKMTSGAGQLTSKLQTQAKQVKMKVSAFPVSELSAKLLNTSQDSHAPSGKQTSTPDLGRCSYHVDELSEEKVVQQLLGELIEKVCKMQPQDQYLRSQGNTVVKTATQKEKTRSTLFDKVEYFAANETESILFSTKIRKKKHYHVPSLPKTSQEENKTDTSSHLISDLHAFQFQDMLHTDKGSTSIPTVPMFIKSDTNNLLIENDEKDHDIDHGAECKITNDKEECTTTETDNIPVILADSDHQGSGQEFDQIEERTINLPLPVQEYNDQCEPFNHANLQTDQLNESTELFSNHQSSSIDSVVQQDSCSSVQLNSRTNEPTDSGEVSFKEDSYIHPIKELESTLLMDEELETEENLSSITFHDETDAETSAALSFDIYASNNPDDNEEEQHIPSIASTLEVNDEMNKEIVDEIADEESNHYFKTSAEYSVKRADSSGIWTIYSTPKNSITQLAASSSGDAIIHIAHDNNMYVAMETSEDSYRLNWTRLDKMAMQVSISPSGDVAWICTTHGDIYASNINRHHNIYNNWTLVKKRGSAVCLGSSEGWMISDEKIFRRSNVSTLQPCGVNHQHIPTDGLGKISQIALSDEVVWLLVDGGSLYCKKLCSILTGVWKKVDDIYSLDGEVRKVKAVVSDYRTTMWVVDELGNPWFRSKVKNGNTNGDQWWQVNMNEYLCEDQRENASSHVFPNSASIAAAEKYVAGAITASIDKVNNWMHGASQVSNICISLRAVWIASSYTKLHVARGPITGNRWSVPSIAGVASSTKWNHITSNSYFSDSGAWEGLIWVANSNGDVVCFPSSSQQSHGIAVEPPPMHNTSVVSVSACRGALWMVLESGVVWVRSGIDPLCLGGRVWEQVDVTKQLVNVKMVHISCGSLCVWAVDSEGHVHMRMGVEIKADHKEMAPAWLTLGPSPFSESGSKFTQVICGPSDINVWAVDNMGNIFVRTDVTSELLIGKDWKVVEGAVGKQIAISNHTVWALKHDGSLLRRCGISHNDYVGDYWKKIPGNFHAITATPQDGLWAIDQHYHIRRHVTRTFYPAMHETCHEDQSDISSECTDSDISLDDDVTWEFI